MRLASERVDGSGSIQHRTQMLTLVVAFGIGRRLPTRAELVVGEYIVGREEIEAGEDPPGMSQSFAAITASQTRLSRKTVTGKRPVTLLSKTRV